MQVYIPDDQVNEYLYTLIVALSKVIDEKDTKHYEQLKDIKNQLQAEAMRRIKSEHSVG